MFYNSMVGKGKQNKMLYNFIPGGTGLQNSREAEERDESTTYSKLQLFDLNTIVEATNNFSLQNELGHGGFCSVYKIESPSQIYDDY